MNAPFGIADWIVMAGYVAVLCAAGWYFTPRKTMDARDYFLASGEVPVWLAAISVLSATQSAATFLGGPDYGFRGDFTYLGANLSALIAAVFVAKLLIPRFYALGATTVYELLDARFGRGAMRAAGALFLVGRVLAGGARVYLAAIAVAMVVFADTGAHGVILSALMIVLASFAFTFHGGLKSVIWNDLVQFVLFIGAAIAVLVYLRSSIPIATPQLIDALAHAPGGQDKLRLIDTSFDLTHPFSIWSILTGVTLLYIGNSGLDQDTTQRLLACRDAKAGALSLYVSVVATIPVAFVFIAIGSLLSVFYTRPELMHGTGGVLAQKFAGAKVTVFMHYILTELPPGLRGLTTVGVLAAAVATTNSALNAMSSVLIQDFYRPWRERGSAVEDRHFVVAGRYGSAIIGLATFGTAALSFYWQRYSNMPLLEFALSVMTFAYAGLLGVYFTAIFTTRGSTTSVILALVAGFLTILLLQPFVVDLLGLPAALRSLSFGWQLCIGTIVSTLVCLTGNARALPHPLAARP